MILDLYAGAGGWDEGARQIGMRNIVGLELWHDACVTAVRAGHPSGVGGMTTRSTDLMAKNDQGEIEMSETAHADMRIEVVKRELNQGALAGFRSEVTDSAALMVIAALDSFDQDALRRAHAEGRAAAAADIRTFVEAKERSVKECPPETPEAFRRNDAVLGAYRRAAEIAGGATSNEVAQGVGGDAQ